MRENGEEIAVKMLRRDYSGFDDKQFQKEFYNLKMLQHQNIVRFVGYCYETQHIPFDYNGKHIFADKTFGALCFEYLHNGSLGKHLSSTLMCPTFYYVFIVGSKYSLRPKL